MSQGLVTASYIVAAVLFILSLAGLSKQETAKHGNLFGIAGMAIALLATVFNPETSGVHWIILAMVIGGAIGVRLALKVEMTEMPELVAVLHSFVGMAAVLVGVNSFIDLHPSAPAEVVVSVGSNLDATLAAARAAFEAGGQRRPGRAPHRRHAEHPPGRDLPGRLHRCRDLHRFRGGLWQTARSDLLQAADAAAPPQAEPAGGSCLSGADGLLRQRGRFYISPCW